MIKSKYDQNGRPYDSLLNKNIDTENREQLSYENEEKKALKKLQKIFERSEKIQIIHNKGFIQKLYIINITFSIFVPTLGFFIGIFFFFLYNKVLMKKYEERAKEGIIFTKIAIIISIVMTVLRYLFPLFMNFFRA